MTVTHKKVPDSIVDTQVERLLDVVQAYNKKYCDGAIAKAEQDARMIIKQAHHDARMRMHQIVVDSREKMQLEIGAAKAKRLTADKQIQYRRDQRLLDVALDKLQELLASHWNDAKQRRVWVDNALTVASRVLLADIWQIEHPAQWPVAEQKQLVEVITKHTGQSPTLSADQDIQAGIRIISQGSVVDATLSGLLVDRPRIEAEFLAQYRAQCGESI